MFVILEIIKLIFSHRSQNSVVLIWIFPLHCVEMNILNIFCRLVMKNAQFWNTKFMTQTLSAMFLRNFSKKFSIFHDIRFLLYSLNFFTVHTSADKHDSSIAYECAFVFKGSFVSIDWRFSLYITSTCVYKKKHEAVINKFLTKLCVFNVMCCTFCSDAID